MANRIERIMNRVKLAGGEGTYTKLIEKYGEVPTKGTTSKQAKYVRDIINELEKKEEGLIKEIMQPCGHKCISKKTINDAKVLFNKAENIEDFLNLLNENGIGGGYLHIKDKKIIGIYDKCYCGMAKVAKDMPVAYCNCSAGWFEKLFSESLSKNVKVEKIQTILGGADTCIFEIEY